VNLVSPVRSSIFDLKASLHFGTHSSRK